MATPKNIRRPNDCPGVAFCVRISDGFGGTGRNIHRPRIFPRRAVIETLVGRRAECRGRVVGGAGEAGGLGGGGGCHNVVAKADFANVAIIGICCQ